MVDIIHEQKKKCNHYLRFWASEAVAAVLKWEEMGGGGMQKPGISQEGLKVIAGVAMLLDHIGAVLTGNMLLRVIGRLAFPIYCFLLSEGVRHTKNPKKYALRLAVGALLSEIPFDLLFFGGITLSHSSVMVTLLLGFLYVGTSKQTEKTVWKVLLAIPFWLLAELLGADYGGLGVALIALFYYTREEPRGRLIRTFGLAALCWLISGARIYIGMLRIPVQMFGILAMIPIGLYSGKKGRPIRAVQWGFYLFYPVHLTALLLIERLMR